MATTTRARPIMVQAKEGAHCAEPLPETFDQKYLEYAFQTFPDLTGLYHWDLEQIRDAKLSQLRGKFSKSDRLKSALKTCPAVHSALLNRLAPTTGVQKRFVAAGGQGHSFRTGGAAEQVRDEATATFTKSSPLMRSVPDVIEGLAMLGAQLCQNVFTPRKDGSRLDLTVCPVPMHAVDWNETRTCFQVRTTDGIVDARHGDGKWAWFTLSMIRPWEWGALGAVALPSADRAYGVRDRSENSATQGQSKIVGTMPPNVSPRSPEGKMFRESMQRMQKQRLSGMVAPHGSEVERVESDSQAWQIFRELIKGDDSDIAKILLGQDGSTNNSGGNYMKADWLRGVRDDIVERDVGAAELGYNTGSFRVWAAVNFGVELAPLFEWMMPDKDQDARRASLSERTKAFLESVKGYRENGFDVDDDFVKYLAESYGVTVPKLISIAAPTTTTTTDPTAAAVDAAAPIAITATDLALCVTVDQVLSSNKLPAEPGGKGGELVAERRARLATVIAQGVAAEQGKTDPSDPAAIPDDAPPDGDEPPPDPDDQKA